MTPVQIFMNNVAMNHKNNENSVVVFNDNVVMNNIFSE